MAFDDPSKPAHLVPVVAGGGLGRVDPEDRQVEPRHRVPERIEARLVRERAVAVPEEARHREVEAAHSEPLDLVLEGAKLVVAEGERLVHLREPDEPSRPALRRVREILGQVAVDVVVLEHGGSDARVVHLHRPSRRTARTGRACAAAGTGRSSPRRSAPTRNGPTGRRGSATSVARPASEGSSACQRGRSRHDRVVAEAPVGLVAVDVHGALLVHEMVVGRREAAERRRAAGRCGRGSRRRRSRPWAPSAAVSRVEPVAQPVPEDVEGEDQERDGDARRDDEMRRDLDELAARGEHRAPFGGRRPNAEAEEAERRPRAEPPGPRAGSSR